MTITRILAIMTALVLAFTMTAFAGAPEKPEGESEGGQAIEAQGAGDSEAGESAGEEAGKDAGESEGGQGGGQASEEAGESAGSQGGNQGGNSGGGMMPGGGGSSKPDSYDAVTEITEDAEIEGETFASENGNENAIHIFEGATVTLKDCEITNAGEGSGGDDASFYGVGATVLVSDGELYISDSEITSTTAGGTGVFAYDTGVAYVSNVTIRNSGRGGCGGIHAAGGGTLYAWNCDVVTTGGSSAAIRSDRGGGLMVIDGGSYITENGTGAVYCTADISVHDAYLYAGASEAIAIEGKNFIRLFDCSLEGNMQASEINDNMVWNCIVYQSMSGDSSIGTSEFDFIDSSLICHAGPVVLNTNTDSYITFKNSEIEYGEDTTYFLQVTGNSSSRTWGTEGKNGADCIFTAYEQEIEHDVLYDTISTLQFYLLDESEFEGAFLCDDTYNGGYTGEGLANVYIDASSKWEVTADSIITGTLYLEGEIEGAQVVGTDGTVYVEGEGFTVTVGGFETTVDTEGAGVAPVWEDYCVENPFE